MKKVTLLVPDKIDHSQGSSRSIWHTDVDVTVENMIQVLCLDDYHERYMFDENDIKVLAIESVSDED